MLKASRSEGCRYVLCLGAEDVVDFERLVDLGEPFGPAGGAAATAFVERQLQLTQQAGDLLARGNMSHARTGAERPLVEIVKRGQAAREKFAVDDALGKSVDRTEAEAEGQILETVGNHLLVARSQCRKPVTHH